MTPARDRRLEWRCRLPFQMPTRLADGLGLESALSPGADMATVREFAPICGSPALVRCKRVSAAFSVFCSCNLLWSIDQVKVYYKSVLYTTLSPCAMCSGAILLYGIPKVVVGENRTFMGEEDWLRSRGVVVVVLQDATCIDVMRTFIASRPDLWNEDIGKIIVPTL